MVSSRGLGDVYKRQVLVWQKAKNNKEKILSL
jgi:hypothetical protein